MAPPAARSSLPATTATAATRSPCGWWSITSRTRPSRRPAPYRLVTTILDPDAAPAVELAALYAQRWELETALDELKTHQRGPNLVLRSKTPEGVEQEVWGMLLVHYAIRQLMHQAALDGEVDPDRVSFVRSLRVVRRQVMRQAGFSPSAAGPGHHGHDC
jgi:hypothetical protein